MEVKVYKRGCDVECHSIPPFVGKTTTTEGRSSFGIEVDSGSESVSDADSVADVADRFRCTPELGAVLERHITRGSYVAGGRKFETYIGNGAIGMVIVPPDELPRVVRITVDGERVWPEPEGEAGAADAIAAQIAALLGDDSV